MELLLGLTKMHAAWIFAVLLKYAPFAVMAFAVWFQVENWLYWRHLTAYKPVPISEECFYTPCQVSIVVCTLNTLLAASLRTWLANNPLEVIIVTVPEHLEYIRSVVSMAQLSPADVGKVTVVTSPEKGKRAQFTVGIKNSHGSVLAMVDDHITWNQRFLESMLPCFEDPRVGAISPQIDAIIPEERRDPDVISPWEVMAMRVRWNSNPRLKAYYAAARWQQGICGVTGLYRSEIMTDPAFIDNYKNETWFGKKIDAGEDNCISRWLQSHDWIIAMQALPETTVFRTVKRDSDFLLQMCRWERSTILNVMRQIVEIKQIRSNIFAFRKTLARLMRPVITWSYIFFCLLSMWTMPIVPFVVFAYFLYGDYPSYKQFLNKYPYMRRYWWAVFVQDYFFVVQDPFCWMTLNNFKWEARKVSIEEQTKIN